jgi:hypothetical protein
MSISESRRLAAQFEPVLACAHWTGLGVAVVGDDFPVSAPFVVGLAALDQGLEPSMYKPDVRVLQCDELAAAEAAGKPEQDERAIAQPDEPRWQRVDHAIMRCRSAALSGSFLRDAVPRRRRMPRHVFFTSRWSVG